MSDLTPELIESIGRHEVQRVEEVARTLHEATTGVLEMPLPPQELADEETLRRTAGLKLSETINYIDAEIARLEGKKKDVRVLKGYLANDCDRIKSQKIEGYIREKEERQSFRRTE